MLVLSLWILALLSLMGSTLAYQATLKMRIVRMHLDKIQGRYLAQAGISWASDILLKQTEKEFHAMNQDWGSSEDLFRKIPLGTGSFSIYYEYAHPGLGTQRRFGIIDAERNININQAPREVLMNLPDATEEIVDAILDWRDKNSQPERRGAEKDYYLDLATPYPSKDGPIERLEELVLIKGMTGELASRWAGFLTVYGDGRVNINTASRETLAVLGLSDDLIEKILEFRQGVDGELGTEDDGVFKNEGAIARTLFEAEPLNSNDVSSLVNLVSRRLLGVKSQFFLVRAVGSPAGREGEGRTVSAVLELAGGSELKIRDWVET